MTSPTNHNPTIESRERACPFIGLTVDPTSLYSYPNPGNLCYRVTPARHIGRAHQKAYCLSAQHQACEVYLQEGMGTLPEVLGSPEKTRRIAWQPFALVVVFLVMVLAYWLTQM